MLKARQRGVMRAQVGFMLAFYALAVCRGLIPGLCATQNALDARLHQAADGCCPSAVSPAGAYDALVADTDPHPDCAFCSLITTTVRSAEAPAPPPHAPVASTACAPAHDAPSLAATWDPVLRRGPPPHA